jgi:hypothetical protein
MIIDFFFASLFMPTYIQVLAWYDKAMKIPNARPIAPPASFSARLLRSPVCVSLNNLSLDDMSSLASDHVKRWIMWIKDAKPVEARQRGHYTVYLHIRFITHIDSRSNDLSHRYATNTRSLSPRCHQHARRQAATVRLPRQRCGFHWEDRRHHGPDHRRLQHGTHRRGLYRRRILRVRCFKIVFRLQVVTLSSDYDCIGQTHKRKPTHLKSDIYSYSQIYN